MSNIVLGNNAMTSAFKNQPRLTGLLQALLTPVDKTMAAEAPAGYQFSIEQALYGIYFGFLLDQKDSDDNWVCTGAQLDVWGRRLDLFRAAGEADFQYRIELIAKRRTLYSNGSGDEVLALLALYIHGANPCPPTIYYLNDYDDNGVALCIGTMLDAWGGWLDLPRAGLGDDAYRTALLAQFALSIVSFVEYFPAEQIVSFQTTEDLTKFIDANGKRLALMLRATGAGGVKTTGVMLTDEVGYEFEMSAIPGGTGAGPLGEDIDEDHGLSCLAYPKIGGELSKVVG